MRFLALLALLNLAAPIAAQPKPLPAELMAPTDALSPADERKAFTLPPGYDAQLVASEPEIQKPMQMAWDAKGRLWVTTSYHYPFAAPLGKGTDKLFVLSDFDATTGKAKTVKTFTSDLNIPIGILPMPDGKSVIVSSIGEIRKYTIAENELKADKMEVLFSGFGWRDTHGMYNSYTLMPDGWVYSCHGFNNDSTVKGKDGHEVKMHSGNVFRFRPDGSRIEVYSRGQVNPFGMTVDPWFNFYTADCHSRPITQNIPGAYYESFGKPHDGLGYAPVTFGYEPGGTGMCGVSWYDAEHFPKEIKGSIFLGNVVTNRVHRAKIEWHGATPKAIQQPDLIVSKDRWFRPVDIKLGPDGAVYVADFYNKIIGHYEVDLKHPLRDKDHGRIWRVVYKGTDGKAPEAKLPGDITTAKDSELFENLFNPNITSRFLAGHQLRQRFLDGKQLDLGDTTAHIQKSPEHAVAVGAWLLFIAQSGSKPVPLSEYEKFLRLSKDWGLKPENYTGHITRALTSRANWGKEEREHLQLIFKLPGTAPMQRAAVEAVIFHPHVEFVAPLLGVLNGAAPDDPQLKHAAKVALRNCLRDAAEWPKEYDPVYADMALAIPSEKAAKYLLAQLETKKVPRQKWAAVAEHVGRYADEESREKFGSSLAAFCSVPEFPDLILGLSRGLSARGVWLKERCANGLISASLKELQTQLGEASPLTAEANGKVVNLLRALLAAPLTVRPDTSLELNAAVIQLLDRQIREPKNTTELRTAATNVLLYFATPEGLVAGRVVLTDRTTPQDLRDKLLLAFAASKHKEARLDARDALKDAPYRTALAVSLALAGTPGGADDLLTAVKMGKAPARLLQEKAIVERLKGASIPDLDKQLAALTKGLPAPDARLADLIKRRGTVFASSKPDKEAGAKLFVKHCSACHKIGEMGGKIAPQLDGIGLRGTERILEDVLDPNRNVDQAFRARVITTKDEKTITGLMLRVEGEVLVLADGEGKEVRIPTKDIEANRETMLSPMPANFGDVMPEADFVNLLAFLLDQKIPAAKKE